MSSIVSSGKQMKPSGMRARLPDSIELEWRSLLCAALFAQSVHDNVVSNPEGPWHAPKVASGIIIVSALVFLKPGGWSKAGVALTPHRVIEDWQIWRILFGAVVHQDILHLVIDMRSLLDNTTHMEGLMTPQELLVDVASLTVVSHAGFVGLAWLQHKCFGMSNTYLTEGPVGFTSVAFSLQIFSSYLRMQVSDRSELVPPQYLSWLNLAFIQLFYRGGFQFQLCGILAGLLRVFVPKPFLWVRRKVCGLFRHNNRRREAYQIDEDLLRHRRHKGDLLKHALWAAIAIAVNLVMHSEGEGSSPPETCKSREETAR